MHEEERATCPYHLKRLVRSCTPNIAQSESEDTSSSSLTPHIQRTIDLSFQRSRCKSGAVGAQVSLSCNRAERTQALKTFPPFLRDTFKTVKKGKEIKCEASFVADFNTGNKLLTQILLKQGYRYHKLLKTFSKFYRRYYDLVSKFQVGLKSFLRQGLSVPEL